jgi:thioester reductase-like protein
VTPRRILLTGAGTIGRELVTPLLRGTSNRIALLMRDRRRQSAEQRADVLFDELELTADERARVEVLQGDVTRSGLGLGVDVQAQLIEELDLIIHTAAATALTADRALCDAVNRAGTANVLMLAERCYMAGRLERLVHLSTAMIAGGESAGLAREDDLPASPMHANHYEWSKYEAERIVRAAMHAGLPVTVFRPSMVVGDTETGRTRDFDVIYPLMRIVASGYVTRFPANPSAKVHLAPLDFVVGAIVCSLDAAWTVGRTFHLTSADPPTVAQLFDCDAFFPSGGRRPQLCPLADFDPASCARRERDLLESVSFCFPYFNSRLSFETRNTRRLLPLPVTDAAYLTRLARYAADAGYLQRMAGATAG